jgi:hypothetical protein
MALAAAIDSTDHTRGGGGPQLVVYGDFECPYTAAAMQSIGALLQSGAEFQLVFRHFPLRSIHPHAEAAAVTSEAAERQGRFWGMHDVLFVTSDTSSRPTCAAMPSGSASTWLASNPTSSIPPSRLESNGTSTAASAAGWMGRPACSSMAFAIADRDPAGLGEALR